MAGRAREGRRSWWIGGSKARAVNTEDNDDNDDGSGGGCWGGCGRGRGFNKSDKGDPITLLVKVFKLNLESFILVSLKIKVYIS